MYLHTVTSYTYELRKPKDLLGKLERELHRLGKGKIWASDHAYNFAVTAWHMTDWVWQHERTKSPGNTRSFGFSSVATFQNFITRDCRDLDICSDLANGSKHFEVERRDRAVIDTDVSLGPSFVLDVSRLDIDALGGPPILKVRLADGSSKRAEDVFKGAVSYWFRFFREHELLPPNAKRRYPRYEMRKRGQGTAT